MYSVLGEGGENCFQECGRSECEMKETVGSGWCGEELSECVVCEFILPLVVCVSELKWREKCIHLEAATCIQSAAAARRDDIAWNVIVRTAHLASSPANHNRSMKELMVRMMGMMLVLLLLLLMLWMMVEDRTGRHRSMGQRSLGSVFVWYFHSMQHFVQSREFNCIV